MIPQRPGRAHLQQVQQDLFIELVDRVSQQSMMLEMLTAHVENLIERVHDLERPPFRA